MKKVALTDIKIRNLKAGPKRYEVWDTIMPAFGVRVTPQETKSFVLMYRMAGRLRRQTLGRYPLLSLADARGMAQDVLIRVSHGDDPLQKTNQARKRGEGDFPKVLGDFIQLHCMRYNKASTTRSTKRLLEKEFLPVWKKRNVADIGKGEILAILDGIVERGTSGAANHAYAAASKFFSWCAERDIISGNPCADVKRPSKLKSRDRVLSDRELSSVWSTAQKTDFPFGAIVQLLILTAQRRGEVTNMEWSHIDFDQATWSIPEELTKSSRAHVVPLTSAAHALIKNLPRLHDRFLFPALGSRTTTFSGFGKCKKRLDEQAGVLSWTLHDLRRTAATGMAEMGTPPHVVERVLNHSSGTFAGVAGVYNRFGYVDEMRKALAAWEQKLRNIEDVP